MPKSITFLSVQLLVGLFFIGCFGASHAADTPYLKGVTYFGDASPTTFWNSNVQRAADDFKEIRADGFNTVVLVVPWGEFQPGVDPVRFNENAYDRLEQVCQAAKSQGLYVLIRTSYLWDYYPGVQMPNFQRANSLLSNDSLMPAWKLYMQKIRAATKDCSHAYFIAWEDFWFMMEVVTFDADATVIADKARHVSFDHWVRKHAGKKFLRKYAAQAATSQLYPMPNRNNPDYRLVFEWFDDQFTRRLMPVMASILPGSSMEVRSDADPIFQGKNRISWFSHQRTYTIKSSPYVMTYWAPAIGAENNHDFQSADKVLDRFSYIQKKISASTENKIFIEQFLFKDNTPEAVHNTQIEPEKINEFLNKVSKPLQNLTAGYALWGAKNYQATLLFNGFFSLGTLGWNFSSDASIISTASGNWASIPLGASISQNVPVLRGTAPGNANVTTVSFTAQGEGKINIFFAEKNHFIDISDKSKLFKIDFPLATKDEEFSINTVQGKINISDLKLYFFIHETDFRSPDGTPNLHYENIKILNSKLEYFDDIPSRLAADDDSFSFASGIFSREQDNGNWYAWASDIVQAKIRPQQKTIFIKGYVKPSMFGIDRKCKLIFKINKIEKKKVVYSFDTNIEVSLNTKPNIPIDLTITSSCSKNNFNQIDKKDTRNLAFILNEIK